MGRANRVWRFLKLHVLAGGLRQRRCGRVPAGSGAGHVLQGVQVLLSRAAPNGTGTAPREQKNWAGNAACALGSRSRAPPGAVGKGGNPRETAPHRKRPTDSAQAPLSGAASRPLRRRFAPGCAHPANAVRPSEQVLSGALHCRHRRRPPAVAHRRTWYLVRITWYRIPYPVAPRVILFPGRVLGYRYRTGTRRLSHSFKQQRFESRMVCGPVN